MACLEIGAAASLTDAYGAIVERYPMLAELAERFGSPPVRNSGTLCGNLANGSPIGDSMPRLIALGAEVVLRRGAEERSIALEALYRGYPGNGARQGENRARGAHPAPSPGSPRRRVQGFEARRPGHLRRLRGLRAHPARWRW
jgi:xanthine dehydrogenase small subunit